MDELDRRVRQLEAERMRPRYTRPPTTGYPPVTAEQAAEHLAELARAVEEHDQARKDRVDAEVEAAAGVVARRRKETAA